MTRRGFSIAFGLALSIFVIGAVQHMPAAESGPPRPCAPTTTTVTTTKKVGTKTVKTVTVVPVPPEQDVKHGSCLFSSKIDFNQRDPNNTFATCSGCHPSNRTDGGTHPVLFNSSNGTFVGARQAPNLLNVAFNTPLGWDGRHGGTLGDPASIVAAIQSAARNAINSPVEIGGFIDPTNPKDQAKLAALAAFLLSRSPTAPHVSEGPPPPSVTPSQAELFKKFGIDPNDPDAADDLAEALARQAAMQAATLARIKTGADVFFGRSASTAGLLAAGKACVSCHVPPFFTDNKIRTNVLHPDAAYDFGFPQADGTTGPQDAGAGLTWVTDPVSGRSIQVGTFKTPSLHRFYPDGEPALHSGIFTQDDRLFRFYEKSLGFKLAAGESTGLHYWLVNCPQGPQRDPGVIPVECN